MAVVERHRTAIARQDLSRPLQQAYRDGLLTPEVQVFDYGCGRGDDVRILRALGLKATGWDPVHAPENPRTPADLVNLGYVVNVIEDIEERAEALRGAWKLTKGVLVVSARLRWDRDAEAGRTYRDGRLTSNGTFQKYYTPEELKAWIESTLGETAITAAPGIYYVFHDQQAAQRLLARGSRQAVPRRGVAELLYEQTSDLLEPLESYVREHRHLPAPTDIPQAAELIDRFGSLRSAFSIIRRATDATSWADLDLGTRTKSEELFEEHLTDLEPLIAFISERGRLPREGELENEDAITAQFGSARAAFSLIRRVTGGDRWTPIEEQARQNFLVYAALAAFGGRPRFSDLPEELQYDAKDLFGSYKAACTEADQLLYGIADIQALDQACANAPFGKLTPEALYVHLSSTSQLPPLLRVYIGAAQVLTGSVDDATIAKLHRQKPQVSWRYAMNRG